MKYYFCKPSGKQQIWWTLTKVALDGLFAKEFIWQVSRPEGIGGGAYPSTCEESTLGTLVGGCPWKFWTRRLSLHLSIYTIHNISPWCMRLCVELTVSCSTLSAYISLLFSSLELGCCLTATCKMAYYRSPTKRIGSSCCMLRDTNWVMGWRAHAA